MVCCCAPSCSARSEQGVRLFAFPTDINRRKRWIINCRRDKWTPSSTSRLCETHFEGSQFEHNRADGWLKLKPNAIPTLFNVPNPPFEIKSKRRLLKRRLDMDEADEFKIKTIRLLAEHSYAKSGNYLYHLLYIFF